MIEANGMKRSISWVFVCLLAATPVLGDQVLVVARDIELGKSFSCGDKERRSGKYGLEVRYDEEAVKSTLTVFKGTEDLCKIEGVADSALTSMASSKVRVFTRVNQDKKAIQVDVVVPERMRAQIPNQVFYLPLAP